MRLFLTRACAKMITRDCFQEFLCSVISVICLLECVQAFGWNTWNNNLLHSISDCPTFDGNRTGICVASAAECRNRKSC